MAVEKTSVQPVGRINSTRHRLAELQAPLYTMMLLLVAAAALGLTYLAYYDVVVDKIMFGIGPFELIFTGIAMIMVYKAYQRFQRF